MAASGAPRGGEETYTTAEAAAILTLAGVQGGAPVSKRAVDGVIDKRLFPGAVVRRRKGARALTAAGVGLAAAEFALRRELPVAEARRRAYRRIVEEGAGAGPVRASGAVIVDVGVQLARAEEAVARYRRLMRRIEVDPEVQRGQPVLRGTRMTAYTIAAIAEVGTPVAEILRHYPSLSAEQVEAARLYAVAHPRRGRPALPRGGRVVLEATVRELEAT